MSSFLHKLRRENIITDHPQNTSEDGLTTHASEGTVDMHPSQHDGYTQLDVDICQTDEAVILFAQTPGCDINDIDVSIEGDNDIVSIQGERKQPVSLVFQDGGEGKDSLREECLWGKFYRQIILPAEVDTEQAEAMMKDGVLVLKLHLKNSSVKKVKMHVVKVQDGRHDNEHGQ